MSAQFYVREAKQEVDIIRSRLNSLGFFQSVDSAIAIEDFASLAGDCSIVRLPNLTERRGLLHLSESVDLSIGDYVPLDTPLAGALCVADRGRLRWILVRDEDIPRRQRFTIAHELGHFFGEVESTLLAVEQGELPIDSLPSGAKSVRMFSRCDSVGEFSSDDSRSRRAALTPADLLEVKADHFASELLMPYDGVRRLIQQIVGSAGISSARELGAIASAISDRYDVSAAAARRRLEKDLAIVPMDEDPNGDLFG